MSIYRWSYKRGILILLMCFSLFEHLNKVFKSMELCSITSKVHREHE